MRAKRFLGSFYLLLVIPTNTGAQERDRTPADGARVRISSTYEGLRQHVALLDSVRRDSVFLPSRGLAMSQVDRLEVSLGRSSFGVGRGAKRGAKLGALIGGATGALMIWDSRDDPLIRAIAVIAAPVVTLLGTAAGALVGAALGARPREHWGVVR